MTKTKLILVGLASMLTLIPAAQAVPQTVSGSFNVTVSLTSVCTIVAGNDLAFGTYTAFQGTAQVAAVAAATLTCTRGSAAGITAAFDTDGAIGSTGAATANPATGAGVLAGLQYAIAATPGTVTAGTVATASTLGTADSRPIVISGSMPAGQAGSAAGSFTQIRTLTITY